MCVIEVRFSCGTIRRERVFPADDCDCRDVIQEEHDIDEECGYCSDCRAARTEGSKRSWDWEDDGQLDDDDEEEDDSGLWGSEVEDEDNQDQEDGGVEWSYQSGSGSEDMFAPVEQEHDVGYESGSESGAWDEEEEEEEGEGERDRDRAGI